MLTVQYRRWCPPQSPLRIEFPAALFQEIRQECARAESTETAWRPWWRRAPQQWRGVLFGIRRGEEVRVLAARAEVPGADEPALRGLEILGMYVSRPRGEVFLTDGDLDTFEQQRAVLALVIAGGRAGFFVRQPDGTMQTIRSHEEFPVAEAAADRASGEAPSPQEPSPPPRRRFWKWAAGAILLITPPAAGFAYLLPFLPRPPLTLNLREDAGQLVISWNPQALADGGRLELREGTDQIVALLGANSSSATYPLREREIEVRVSTDTRTGTARWERHLGGTHEAIEASPEPALHSRITALTEEAGRLRESLASGRIRVRQLVAELEKNAATDERR